MVDDSPAPVFTGAELALADTMILIMKVMAMRGIIDEEAINTVFSDMQNRYRGQNLHSAAAMAEYLLQNTIDSDQEAASRRLHGLIDRAPEGSA